MPTQPTPEVSDDDVARIVERDFKQSKRMQASSLLNEYGSEDWHREHARVRLAALKLANGSVKRLALEIENAKCDYRDTLGPAEYPGYLKHYSKDYSEDEKQAIIESDWRQYQEWLNR